MFLCPNLGLIMPVESVKTPIHRFIGPSRGYPWSRRSKSAKKTQSGSIEVKRVQNGKNGQKRPYMSIARGTPPKRGSKRGSKKGPKKGAKKGSNLGVILGPPLEGGQKGSNLGGGTPLGGSRRGPGSGLGGPKRAIKGGGPGVHYAEKGVKNTP